MTHVVLVWEEQTLSVYENMVLRRITGVHIELYNEEVHHLFSVLILLKGKGKAALLQAWSGPEGSRKLRFPDFMTTAQDGGKGVSLTHRPPLPPGNTPDTHFR